MDDPVDYGDMKAEDFVPGPAAAVTDVVSGSPIFEKSFKMATINFQEQFVNLCEEVDNVLKLDSKYLMETKYGINPQLDSNVNKTGVLGDTSDATGKAYGIQCFMKGFEQFQNFNSKTAVDINVPADSEMSNAKQYTFEPAPVVNGQPSWMSDPDSVDSCRYCFDGFIVSTLTNDDVVLEHVVSNTTKISKGCNCMGLFPVPENICFSEFNYLDSENPFKCMNSNMFTTSLTDYMAVGGNSNWWVDYVYATKDEDNKFERIAMAEITVQTQLDVFATDAWKGMDMVKAWDDWADSSNSNLDAGGSSGMSKVMVYCSSAPKWRQTILLMPAAIQGVVLSLVLSWMVLVVACENWILASLAIMTITMIVTIVFGFLTFSGWGLGLLEGILVVLVIGFSVDYTVHLSDSYKACEGVTRYEKVKFALESTGTSIVSGAISTVGAAAIMLTANIAFFVKVRVGERSESQKLLVQGMLIP